MAKRRKSGKSSGKWNFSITSFFVVFYALYKFGFLTIVTNLLQSGKFDINAIVNSILNNFNITNIINVMMVSIQVKLLASIAKAVSGPSLGKIWKLNLRW